MKERPIFFSGPMVRALLNGSKTQTRRVVKARSDKNMGPRCVLQPHELAGEVNRGDYQNCPYGQPGDRLWLRETFRGCRAYEVRGYAPKDWGNKPIWFEADGTPPGRPEQWALRSRPSIHMPRWASRITLEVTGVRVERLQDISKADAMAEGVAETAKYLQGLSACLEHCYAYEDLWESINGAGSWDANPWVWVVNFKAEGVSA